MEELQPDPRPARLRQRIGEEPGAGIVEVYDRHEIDARAVRLPGRGAPDGLDLRGRGRGHLAGDDDGAADHAGRGRGRGIPVFPRRRRALELHDVLQGELVECRAIAVALEQIEQCEPREHGELGIDVVLDALFELLAGIHGLPVGEPERGVFQDRTQSGIRPRHLERRLRRGPLREARAGDGHVAAGRLDMPARTLGSRLRRELARGCRVRPDLGLRRFGWFAERGIRAGDRVTGLPSPKP